MLSENPSHSVYTFIVLRQTVSLLETFFETDNISSSPWKEAFKFNIEQRK